MQKVSEKPSLRRRGRPAAAGAADDPPEEVRDRLAELLPEEALQDALKGLDGSEITGSGGLLSQLAGRVIDAALRGELTDHLGYPPGRLLEREMRDFGLPRHVRSIPNRPD